MELSHTPVNIFIFGDLVLDHFIPLTAKKQPYQAAPGEQVFYGHPRRTIPGGAANCARLIAALGAGRVCLWGLSGHSPWGSFAQILEKSLPSDRPDHSVIYHGSHNESHKMNTITRLVSIDDEGIRHRHVRVDDVPAVPVTDGEERDAMAYFRAEFARDGIHAVIINDLDMNSLTLSLVKSVGDFAQEKDIPIFIDPKRDWTKHKEIHVTCATPNLKEWCHIVEDPYGEEKWRREINDGHLERLAVRCLRYMPNADFHLIKCDKDGAVLTGPSGAGQRLIRHIAAPTHTRNQQLGAGDMLVAALAMEYASLTKQQDKAERMSRALEKALGVVACYLQMDWQEVPGLQDVKLFKPERMRFVTETTVPESVRLLPEDNVNLWQYSVMDSDLVSVDSTYRKKIEEFVEFLRDGWEAQSSGSAILTGRGGVGKSTVVSILRRVLGDFQIAIWDGTELCRAKNINAALHAIKGKLSALPADAKGMVVVIDEAFSKAGHLLHLDKGKLLIQQSEELRPMVRFVFIDADLDLHRRKLSESQFLSRCSEYSLPPIAKRHCDIPYIFAKSCLSHLDIDEVKISEIVLLAIINWVLKTSEEKQSPRNIFKKAKAVTDLLRKGSQLKASDIVEISKRHLPQDLVPKIEESEVHRHFFHFSWRSLDR